MHTIQDENAKKARKREFKLRNSDIWQVLVLVDPYHIHYLFRGTQFFSKGDRHENCWQHGQHAFGTKQIKLRNQGYMAYLELKIVYNASINHQKRVLLMEFFINLLLIESKLLPQSSQFASNILKFGEEPDKLTKMLPEPNNTILMSVVLIASAEKWSLYLLLYLSY